jgi:hypothetical protein
MRNSYSQTYMSISVAVRSKAWVGGRSFVGNKGSNPAGGTNVCLLCVLYVVSRDFCDGPFTCPEESYRMCVCVCVCFTACNQMHQ